jgi:hypothetical protein
VRCVSLEQQQRFHQGYEPRDTDLHDLATPLRSQPIDKAAQSLYEDLGFEVTVLQMRKHLSTA